MLLVLWRHWLCVIKRWQLILNNVNIVLNKTEKVDWLTWQLIHHVRQTERDADHGRRQNGDRDCDAADDDGHATPLLLRRRRVIIVVDVVFVAAQDRRCSFDVAGRCVRRDGFGTTTARRRIRFSGSSAAFTTRSGAPTVTTRRFNDAATVATRRVVSFVFRRTVDLGALLTESALHPRKVETVWQHKI